MSDKKKPNAAEQAVEDTEQVTEQVAPEVDKDPVEQLTAELESVRDMLMRTAAEFDNYKKRTERERAQLSEYVRANTVKPLLPVLDNIGRAVGVEDATEYAKGLEMIIKQVRAASEQMGIESIEAEGKPFDPAFHEAVMHIEDENLGENTVAEVLQQGYKVGDTVIRPAMVKVAN